MIPKKIHYVWFSNDMPNKTQEYIDGWKRLLPDYEIIKWNADNFDINSVKWVKQAVEAKKWAFATDYIRLWALYNHGGIYLDADVECLKSFDDILRLPYFLGREQTKGIIEMAVLGAEPKCEWINDGLSYYKDKNFILPNGEFSIESIPYIMLRILRKKYGLLRIKNADEFNFSSKQIQILPAEFFSPKRWNAKNANTTENTYCIHHFEGGWVKTKNKGFIANCAMKILGENSYLDLLWLLYGKGKCIL